MTRVVSPSASSRSRRRTTGALGGLALLSAAAVFGLHATPWGPPADAPPPAGGLHGVRRDASGGAGGPPARPPTTATTTTTAGHPRTRSAAGGALLTALATSAYTLVSDAVVYSRYSRMYDRRVDTPAGPVAYDIVGRVWAARGAAAAAAAAANATGGGGGGGDGGGTFAVVIAVPFDAATRTFTLVREYSPAHGRRTYGFAGGVVEAGETPAAAAAREMDEETRTVCGAPGGWVDLLGEPEAAAGAPQDKYQREVVHYFLCTAARPAGAAALPRDAGEVMDVVGGVSPAALRTVVRGGGMQANCMAAALLALDVLGL